MKQTFKADPGITVTVEVDTNKKLSRLDVLQLASQTLMLHGQALAAPIDIDGEEVSLSEREWEELDEADKAFQIAMTAEAESQEVCDAADDLGFDARTSGNLIEEE